MLEKFGIDPSLKNFVFIGEAGCGKSEIAINLAVMLARDGDRPVHFFDLDMTKPLFRSRDLKEELEREGVQVFYEEQYMDAPTAVGGVRNSLLDKDVITIMDVGGDHIGARLIGGYAPYINRDETGVYYVINPFRPWSTTIEHVNGVLSEVLSSCHIPFDKVKLVANPNIGKDTSAELVMEGWETLYKMIHIYRSFDFCVVEDNVEITGNIDIPIPVMKIKRYLVYPWST